MAHRRRGRRGYRRPGVDRCGIDLRGEVAGVNSNDRLTTRILMVDDNKDATESLAIVLQMDGSNVHIAEKGSRALATSYACRT